MTWQGKTFAFAAADTKHVWRDGKFTAGLDALDLAGLAGQDPDSTVYIFTVLENDRARYVEFRLLTPGGALWNKPERIEAAAWLAGRPAKEGETYHLQKGSYPLLIQAALGQCERGGKIWIAPRFVDLGAAFSRRRERFDEQVKVWQAYQGAAGKLFLLAPGQPGSGD
jgi:hypothetical protein